VRALRAEEPLPTTETPFEESTLEAPAGLIPTAKERELVGAAGERT
jgi:carbon starvation protein